MLKNASAIIVAVTAALIVAVLWSTRAEIDQISRAPGRVIPSGRVQIVQSADGGVITDLRVREGAFVRRGEVLVRLDKIRLNAAVEESQAKVAALLAAIARIDAELYERPLAFPAEVRARPDLMRDQTELYDKRRSALKAEIAAIGRAAELVREELNLNQPLLKSGDVSKTEVLRLERALADLEGQGVNRKNKYLQDLQADRAKASEDLVAAQQVLTQRVDSFDHTDITAPVDGVVKNVRLTTVGGVLRPGDEVLQIVPTGEELIVEAKVNPADIAYIRAGQQANVKFDAYDSAIHGAAGAVVSYVSADTLSEAMPNGEQIYYRVHLTTDIRTMKPGPAAKKIEIQPGMTATVEIKTGSNTVFRYLTKPILKTVGTAMTER